jgi:hypothetical protein
MLRKQIRKIPPFVFIVRKLRQFMGWGNRNLPGLFKYFLLFKVRLIHKRYKKILIQKKYKLLEGKKIRVVFFVSQKQLWGAQSLYEKLNSNDYFEALVVVFPNNEDRINKKSSTMKDNYDFFLDQGINVVNGYDLDNNTYFPASSFNPDIVFYDQPSPQIHKSLLWPNLSKTSLVCYIPYGYKIAPFYEAHFNLFLHNSSWHIFAESEWHKKQFIKYGSMNGRNVSVSGYPKLDQYNSATKIENRDFKRIIWAPHWSISNNGYSTFDENCNFFLQYASANPNIHWVFKPHQRLRHYLEEIGFMTKEEVENYYEQWDKLPNATFYNEANYINLLKDSDALITDCGSFLAEYLPTKNPILLLISKNNQGYNEIGARLVDSYYQATDNNLIEDFINEVVIEENDSLKDKRLLNLKFVQPNSQGAGQFIVDYLQSQLVEEIEIEDEVKNDEVSLERGQFSTPILFLVYNSLVTTKAVFETIKKSQPKKLYIASDGPKEGNTRDKELVECVRDFVLSNIDWKCEIFTLFRDKNLGNKYACSGAVDWFFSKEEMGIILEDDTVPKQSFFKYCEVLLKYYQHDERIGMIAGNAPLNNHAAKDSYYFSRYVRFWGWASWRRAWRHYEVEYPNFDNFIKTGGLSTATSSRREEKYWQKVAEKGITNTWDFQWLFTCWEQSMLTIIPSVNLVSNHGFHPGATHTTNIHSPHNRAASFEIKLPLAHPKFVIHNKLLDDQTIELEFLASFTRRVMFRVSKLRRKLNIYKK